MNIIKLTSIMERQYPTNVAEIVEILNDLIDDGEDLLKGAKFEYINIVDGQRFYKLKSPVADILSVSFQNTSSNYIPINRLVGKSDTGEIE